MITWRPLTEHPAGPASAMIRATSEETGEKYSNLLPGPVMWSIANQRWEHEDTGGRVRMCLPGTVYEWAHENEIVGESSDGLAK